MRVSAAQSSLGSQANQLHIEAGSCCAAASHRLTALVRKALIALLSGGETTPRLSRRLPPRWMVLAPGVLETACFVTAAFAYLLPFVAPDDVYTFRSLPGLVLFVDGFVVLGAAPWPSGLVLFAAFSGPLIAAIIGTVYRRRARWRQALVGLICAFAGLAGLVSAFAFDRAARWESGIYVAAGAFLLAGVVAAFRFVTAVRRRGDIDGRDRGKPDEPAQSAMQELLRRSRGS